MYRRMTKELYEIVDIASSECSILFNGSCYISHGRGIVLINSWECARFFEVQDLVTYVPFLLKDNTRCGSCIYLTRVNGKIVLSPKIHGKSFENTEMPEKMKVQNLIIVVHIQTSRSFFVLRWENIRIPSPSPDCYWCLEQIRAWECWVTFVMYMYCRSLLSKEWQQLLLGMAPGKAASKEWQKGLSHQTHSDKDRKKLMWGISLLFKISFICV